LRDCGSPVKRAGVILGSPCPSETNEVNVTGSRKLKIGIIGCGVGFLHLQGFAENPRADVVAIAGLDEDRCRELARQFDVPRVYRDYQDLVADQDIEAVTVAVPNILHVPVALAALAAGKHVMVEKPLAPSSEEGLKII
jgi:predicted dehydrogenase